MEKLSAAIRLIVLEKGINLMAKTGVLTIPGVSRKQEVKVEWRLKKTQK